MHKLVVVREDTDVMVLSRIRALAPQRSMTRPGVSQWLKRILAMRRLAIGTAQVLGVSGIDHFRDLIQGLSKYIVDIDRNANSAGSTCSQD
jgi:hypothetical protein